MMDRKIMAANLTLYVPLVIISRVGKLWSNRMAASWAISLALASSEIFKQQNGGQPF